MAMLNWEGWAANFLGWGSASTVPPAPALPNFNPKPAGGPGGKRKKYIIQGKQYSLTPDEMRQAMVSVLKQEPTKSLPKPLRKPAETLKRVVDEAKETKPTYEASPGFDALWGEFMARQQSDAAAMLRDIADGMERERLAIEADDEEIFALLRMIPDD